MAISTLRYSMLLSRSLVVIASTVVVAACNGSTGVPATTANDRESSAMTSNRESSAATSDRAPSATTDRVSARHDGRTAVAIDNFGTAATDNISLASAATDAARVRVVDVREAVPDRPIRAIGVLGPKDELGLAFKVAGIVDRVEVDQGDRVERGSVLAVLDRTEIDAGVERAAQAAAKAERDLARTRALYTDDVATLEQLEHASTARNIARADLEAAHFNARHARIVAPAAGLVLRRLADPSELVEAGELVLVLGSLDQGWIVRAAVTDRDVVQLSVGDAARITFDAFPGATFAGRIDRLATASDPATGTYEVELSIDSDGKRFVQGLIAKVEIDAGLRAHARLFIPVEALLEANGDHATVFVIAPSEEAPARGGDVTSATVERRRVRIGELVDRSVEVREGLRLGERVVTDGAAWLTDGAAAIALARAE